MAKAALSKPVRRPKLSAVARAVKAMKDAETATDAAATTDAGTSVQEDLFASTGTSTSTSTTDAATTTSTTATVDAGTTVQSDLSVSTSTGTSASSMVVNAGTAVQDDLQALELESLTAEEMEALDGFEYFDVLEVFPDTDEGATVTVPAPVLPVPVLPAAAAAEPVVSVPVATGPAAEEPAPVFVPAVAAPAFVPAVAAEAVFVPSVGVTVAEDEAMEDVAGPAEAEGEGEGEDVEMGGEDSEDIVRAPAALPKNDLVAAPSVSTSEFFARINRMLPPKREEPRPQPTYSFNLGGVRERPVSGLFRAAVPTTVGQVITAPAPASTTRPVFKFNAPTPRNWLPSSSVKPAEVTVSPMASVIPGLGMIGEAAGSSAMDTATEEDQDGEFEIDEEAYATSDSDELSSVELPSDPEEVVQRQQRQLFTAAPPAPAPATGPAPGRKIAGARRRKAYTTEQLAAAGVGPQVHVPPASIFSFGVSPTPTVPVVRPANIFVPAAPFPPDFVASARIQRASANSETAAPPEEDDLE